MTHFTSTLVKKPQRLSYRLYKNYLIQMYLKYYIMIAYNKSVFIISINSIYATK